MIKNDGLHAINWDVSNNCHLHDTATLLIIFLIRLALQAIYYDGTLMYGTLT